MVVNHLYTTVTGMILQVLEFFTADFCVGTTKKNVYRQNCSVPGTKGVKLLANHMGFSKNRGCFPPNHEF